MVPGGEALWCVSAGGGGAGREVLGEAVGGGVGGAGGGVGGWGGDVGGEVLGEAGGEVLGGGGEVLGEAVGGRRWGGGGEVLGGEVLGLGWSMIAGRKLRAHSMTTSMKQREQTRGGTRHSLIAFPQGHTSSSKAAKPPEAVSPTGEMLKSVGVASHTSTGPQLETRGPEPSGTRV